jgi:SH3-like domain-containing protein
MRRVILSCLVMAISLSAESVPAVINRPVANMFAKPDGNSAVVSQAIFGVNIQVVEEQPSWLKVRTPDDYMGWIEAGAAVKRDVYAAGVPYATVKNLFGSVYRDASITRHQPVHTLPFEARLEVVAEPEIEERRWIQVRLPDGKEGWIQRGDVSLDHRQVSREEILQFSKRFAGLPYLWGGVSTFGYDCSGFVQMLYRQTGLIMPRDAQPQHDWAGVEEVSNEDLKPGDLVYFGSSNKKITHTGMYIGDGEFIHATAHLTPVVQVSRLSEERWTKLLVGARRVK